MIKIWGTQNDGHDHPIALSIRRALIRIKTFQSQSNPVISMHWGRPLSKVCRFHACCWFLADVPLWPWKHYRCILTIKVHLEVSHIVSILNLVASSMTLLSLCFWGHSTWITLIIIEFLGYLCDVSLLKLNGLKLNYWMWRSTKGHLIMLPLIWNDFEPIP